MWNLKKMIQINLFMKQKQNHRHRKQHADYQRGKERRNKSGVWDQQIHTAIYKIETNKNLLYSTGNYTQYAVIAYNGKEHGKRNITENRNILNQIHFNKK